MPHLNGGYVVAPYGERCGCLRSVCRANSICKNPKDGGGGALENPHDKKMDVVLCITPALLFLQQAHVI